MAVLPQLIIKDQQYLSEHQGFNTYLSKTMISIALTGRLSRLVQSQYIEKSSSLAFELFKLSFRPLWQSSDLKKILSQCWYQFYHFGDNSFVGRRYDSIRIPTCNQDVSLPPSPIPLAYGNERNLKSTDAIDVRLIGGDIPKSPLKGVRYSIQDSDPGQDVTPIDLLFVPSVLP
ncbi:hypothetical protein Tco_0718174 [Tanacetum coccineum]